jgi:hypothetical protein
VTSIFQHALGGDFARLHPRLRERFGFGADDAVACVGTGVMDEIWRGRAYTVPFLYLGTLRNLLFPERGRGIPFTIENYAYRDGRQRDTITFVRTFDVAPGRRRRFDATMVYDPASGRVVDFLGTHQHYAAALDFSVDDGGGLVIRTGAQYLRRLPFPVALAARAQVRESWDEKESCFRIAVRVDNPRFGPVFGYHGQFTARYLDTAQTPIPAAVRPMRENPLP